MIKIHFNIYFPILQSNQANAHVVQEKQKTKLRVRREKKRNEMKRGEIFSISMKKKELNAIR